MRFLHLTDVHLGYRQYNLAQRFEDFANALERVIQHGIETSVDAILITGDLLDKPDIAPEVFDQVDRILRPARDRGLPVIVVEGNHDRSRTRGHLSWLSILARLGYIKLLSMTTSGDQFMFRPIDSTTNEGGYIDIGNVRIAGVQWLGASAGSYLPDVANALTSIPGYSDKFNVLMMHAGLEGEMPRVTGGLTADQIKPLRSCVDYLALGHLHKPFERDGWVFNPGSLEVEEISERQWPKGFYEVEVHDDQTFTAVRIRSKHRPFYSERVQVEAYGEPAALYRGIGNIFEQLGLDWEQEELRPVVEVRLEGMLPFDAYDLDFKVIARIVLEKTNALHVLVNRNRLTARGQEIQPDVLLAPEELEWDVMREIARRDSRYESQADAWANLMLDVKKIVLDGEEPEAVLRMIQGQLDKIEGQV